MNANTQSHTGVVYEFRLHGTIDGAWQQWLDDVKVTVSQNETRVRATLADQNALHGVLKRIRDAGWQLIAVQRIDNTGMRVAVFHRYGDASVMQLETRPIPSPKAGEVLIQVEASTINSADWRLRSLQVPSGYGLMVRLFMGWQKPKRKVLGTELAGTIVATGSSVTGWQPGDQVVAFTGSRLGAHAQYVVVDTKVPMIAKPPSLNWSEAAAMCFGGTTAVDFLINRGDLKAGQRVLINGAGGSVGTAAIQIASHLGAQVTAVCSQRHAKLVRQLGATEVIDYTKQDFTQSNQQWDLIFDLVGNATWPEVLPVLRPDGKLLMAVSTLTQGLTAPLRRGRQGQRCINATAREKTEDLKLLAQLADAGAFKPVIGKEYPFTDIQQAHQHLDAGHKQGAVVLRMDQ